MKESQFIERNKDKWKNFESQLDAGDKNPGNLKEQFIQVTDDLSYSRTFYKNRSVRVYLNLLAQRIYNNVFKNKPGHLREIKSFFVDEVQHIAFKSRHILLLSLAVALLGFGIGWLITANDPEFPSSFFGQNYVEITKENIKNGDPLGIYKRGHPMESFVAIGFNNMRVAILIFVSGLLFSFGAMAVTFYNGIMVGVFMCFFYQYGIIKEFHLTVWLHGTIEMLTMVVECAAGILLGKAFLFPGTYSRSKAFYLNARKGSLLLLSTFPLIIFAAFIEGFITRYNDFPDIVRLLLILGSLAFMVGYYVLIPFKKFRFSSQNELKDLGEDNLQQENRLNVNSETLKNGSKIFYESLKMMADNVGYWLKPVLAGSVVLTASIYFFLKDSVFLKYQITVYNGELDFFSNGLAVFENIPLLLNSKGTWLGILVALWASYLALSVKKMLYAHAEGVYVAQSPRNVKFFFWIFIGTFIFFMMPFLENSNLSWLLFFTVPFWLLPIFKKVLNAKYPWELRNLWKVGVGGGYLLFLSVLIMMLIAAFFILSPFFSFSLGIMEWLININSDSYEIVIRTFFIGILYLIIGISISVLFTSMTILAWTVNERIHALGLQAGVEKVGEKAKIFGLESE
jgi:uncharacterized membrane protein SpoIIM required for sporulation